jgi:hypothetical protein
MAIFSRVEMISVGKDNGHELVVVWYVFPRISYSCSNANVHIMPSHDHNHGTMAPMSPMSIETTMRPNSSATATTALNTMTTPPVRVLII